MPAPGRLARLIALGWLATSAAQYKFVGLSQSQPNHSGVCAHFVEHPGQIGGYGLVAHQRSSIT